MSGFKEMSFRYRCSSQCRAIHAYGELLGICDEWAIKRWVVYGHANRWAKKH